MAARQPEPIGANVMRYRLHSRSIWVDVRMLEVDGRWIASADTPDGASLGCGVDPFEALWGALQPFDGIDELLASMPALDPQLE
ncbi:MAG: hypothetical protein ACXWWU_07435 [Candidatus Limnocylindria bacterium]